MISNFKLAGKSFKKALKLETSAGRPVEFQIRVSNVSPAGGGLLETFAGRVSNVSKKFQIGFQMFQMFQGGPRSSKKKVGRGGAKKVSKVSKVSNVSNSLKHLRHLKPDLKPF